MKTLWIFLFFSSLFLLLKFSYPTSFCSSVCFKDVMKAVKNNTLIIDIRPKAEVADTGLIETSINIPLICLRANMDMSRHDFKEEHGRVKPRAHALVIITGDAGRHCKEACNILKAVGYKKVAEYIGGWEEYDMKKKFCSPGTKLPPCMNDTEEKPPKPCGKQPETHNHQ